ncbi:MAG: hypothetical protein JXA25_00205 [Anaerolineales bacterium]|nr:hypothetical protein [Anaerolineales bacterium]
MGFSLAKNHPIIDEDLRMGHAAVEIFLVFNGWEIETFIEKQEQVILRIASGESGRQKFKTRLRDHLVEK